MGQFRAGARPVFFSTLLPFQVLDLALQLALSHVFCLFVACVEMGLHWLEGPTHTSNRQSKVGPTELKWRKSWKAAQSGHHPGKGEEASVRSVWRFSPK